MPNLKWWHVVSLVLAFLVVSGAIFYNRINSTTPGGTMAPRYLEVRDSDQGKLYCRWPVYDDECFSIEFVHSVHQSQVCETFTILGNEIRPKAVKFSSFGAGMQSHLEEGQQMQRDGDSLIITGYGQSYKKMNYIVGTVSDHILHINGEVVSLKGICGKNAHITILVK